MSTTLATTSPLIARILKPLVPARLRKMAWRSRYRQHLKAACRGAYMEPEVCAAIRRHLRPGGIALDVGANRGLITLLMAQIVGPEGMVVAYEPFPDNVKAIDNALKETGFAERVEVLPIALNDGSVDQVDLYLGRGESCSELNILGHDINGSETEAVGTVRAYTLDQTLKSDTRVDLIKIDVEGAEGMVLDGATKTLLRHGPALVIEVHSRENWDRVMKLKDLGYKITSLEPDGIVESRAVPARQILATRG